MKIKNSITKNPKNIKKADIVVGIPSLNEGDNIDFVTQQIDQGLKKYFKKYRAVIVNVDNNSDDKTKEVFLETKTTTPKVYVSTPGNIRGKGNNFLNLFHFIKTVNARYCMVIDADMKSIDPAWVKKFLEPIINKKYQFVSPFYTRNEYDGTITNSIVYPLIYGLYGIDMRQPIGGDFAFSSDLINIWADKKWHKTTKQYGVDIFMTMGAILSGAKSCQIKLGEKIHKPSAPKLGPMFSQVVSTLFKNIISSKEQWQAVEKVKRLPTLGKEKCGKPQPLGVDYKSMKVTALFEYASNSDILKRALAPENFKKIDKMFKEKSITIGRTLWTKVVYDAIYAYETTDLNNGLIEALKPLYFGRVITFIKATLDMSYEESEEEILEQAKRFWELRSYLLEKYEN